MQNKRRSYHASRWLRQSNPKSVSKERFQIQLEWLSTSVLLATFQLPAAPVWPPVTTSLIESPTMYLVRLIEHQQGDLPHACMERPFRSGGNCLEVEFSKRFKYSVTEVS